MKTMKYTKPFQVFTMGGLLHGTHRAQDLKRPTTPLFAIGDASLLQRACVAVVGSREVSKEGIIRARRMGQQLAEAGVVVMSGLAAGVDTEALTAAIQAGGKTIAVIGTALSEAYPPENAGLQALIAKDHLLISPFTGHEPTNKGHFPQRNRVMAAISDGTVVIEASDQSGTLHQTAECIRLKRWLFLLRSLIESKSVQWPKTVVQHPNVVIVDSVRDVVDFLGRKPNDSED